MTNFTTIWK